MELFILRDVYTENNHVKFTVGALHYLPISPIADQFDGGEVIFTHLL